MDDFSVHAAAGTSETNGAECLGLGWGRGAGKKPSTVSYKHLVLIVNHGNEVKYSGKVLKMS